MLSEYDWAPIVVFAGVAAFLLGMALLQDWLEAR